MKNIVLILILVVLSCKRKTTATEVYQSQFKLGIDVNAKISRIDSIGNYYLVFVENEKEFFKIVSERNQIKYHNSIKVEVGEYYKFRIQQVTDRSAPSNNKQWPRPVNYLDFTQCHNFGKTEICTESTYELATAHNLSGLYLRKE